MVSSAYDSELLAGTVLNENAALEDRVSALQEALTNIDAQLAIEDRNWARIFGGAQDDEGFKLDALLEQSEIIKNYITESPLIGRAADLRQSYIWGKGVTIEGSERKRDQNGRPGKIVAFVNNLQNQECLFSEAAKPIVERASATDGNLFFLGHQATKELHLLPLSKVTDVIVNPRFQDEAWAYMVTETSRDRSGTVKSENVWYFTDRAPQAEVDSGLAGLKAGEKLDKDYRIIDIHFNRQVGRLLGDPDLYSAVGWNRTYIRAMKGGVSMTDAMATFAYRASVSTKAGADNAAAKLSQGASGRAKLAITGQANELTALATTGRAYSFGELRPIAALIASAARVSVVHLLSDPGAAGSSYGSASNLDAPLKASMRSRQSEWAHALKRILKWGTGEDVPVSFPPIDDPDPYREMQTLGLAWGFGTTYPKEVRNKVLHLLDIEATGGENPPAGVLIPNNAKSLARKDIDTDGSGGGSGSSGALVQGQGQSTEFGGAGGAVGDQRNDIISETMKAMQIDRLEEIAQRMERAAAIIGANQAD